MAYFLNGSKQNELYPDTFLLPSSERLDLAGVGCTFYVCITDNALNGGERFWVKCTSIDNQTDTFKCKVVNQLLDFNLSIGDYITISRENILNIQTPEELEETIEFGRQKGIDKLYKLIERYEKHIPTNTEGMCDNHTHVLKEINNPWTIQDLKNM